MGRCSVEAPCRAWFHSRNSDIFMLPSPFFQKKPNEFISSCLRVERKKINFKSRVWVEQQDFEKRRRGDYPQGSRGGARRIDAARRPGSTRQPPLPLTSYPSIFSANVQVCGKKNGFYACSGFAESDSPVVWVWGESRRLERLFFPRGSQPCWRCELSNVCWRGWIVRLWVTWDLQ